MCPGVPLTYCTDGQGGVGGWGGCPKEIFGSEILAKREFLGSMKDVGFYWVTFSIFQVKWARENFHHDFAAPYVLRLASGDTAGHVIIWDISQGKPLTEFSDGTKPILDLEWLVTQDACHDLLAVLHAPSSLILWNADTGTKLWKKTFQESLLCFAFDHFIPSNVTCKFCFKNSIKSDL